MGWFKYDMPFSEVKLKKPQMYCAQKSPPRL